MITTGDRIHVFLTFGHVGDDDTDKEDDGIEPVVAENKGDDEESHSQENSHTW